MDDEWQEAYLKSLADFICEMLDTADNVPAFLAANNKSFAPTNLLSGSGIGGLSGTHESNNGERGGHGLGYRGGNNGDRGGHGRGSRGGNNGGRGGRGRGYRGGNNVGRGSSGRGGSD